jgi:hypothetical protein
MPPQNNLSPVGLTREDFHKYYWFTSLQMVTVVNPTEEDYPFMVEMRHYMVKAGEKESFVGPIANIFLNHMSKKLAQDDNRLEMMADLTYLAASYKNLIVEVKDLAPQYDPSGDWQHRVRQSSMEVPPWAKPDAEQPSSDFMPSTPPWEQPPAQQHPAPPETQQTVAEESTAESTTEASAPPKDETKEFELNGLTFKSVTKDGNTTYYKDSKEIDESTFAKAASML